MEDIIERKVGEYEKKFKHWPDGIRAFAEKDLSEKELRVLDLRHERKTLEEVGKEFGVKRERIRQIEAKANEKIKLKSCFKDWLRQALTEISAEAHQKGEDEGYSATKLLFDRMKPWQAEWRAEHPKDRELTTPDALKLIEWKLERVVAEARKEEMQRIITIVKTSKDALMFPATEQRFLEALQSNQ